MAIRTSSQSGNWSATSTWGGAAVPVNGDAVVISGGHDIVFDVDQSAFANGLLSLQIDGILRFKTDIITCLKMNGNITGTGAIYVGNSEADPIQRPPIGTESRCQLIGTTNPTINLPIIRFYGWYPEREFTQLDADAALNATQIVLKEHLDLQGGDKLVIGCGSIFGPLTETVKGIYTVSSYDSGTKTVTLTGGLQTARLKDDYVGIISKPVKISRTSGTTGWIVANDVIIKGVNFAAPCYNVASAIYNDMSLMPKNGLIEHCSSYSGDLTKAVQNCIFNKCVVGIMGYGIVSNSFNCVVNDSLAINGYLQYNSWNGIQTNNCVEQNVGYMGGECLSKNLIRLNAHTLGYNQTINIIDGVISCNEYNYIGTSSGSWNYVINTMTHYLKRVTIKENSVLFKAGTYILSDCIFENNITILNKNLAIGPKRLIQSFNHNQVVGDYRAWCKGGKIETVDNKLKFICESADYPVFRDYIIQAPANRTIKFLIGLTKDTSGILTKLQIIDPSNDPLIDSTATPLAESTAQNNINAQQLGVAYKSTTSKQLILRILCQNSSGNVTIDTTRIDQILAKRIN